MVKYEELESKRLELHAEYKKENNRAAMFIGIGIFFIVLLLLFQDSDVTPIFFVLTIAFILTGLVFAGKAQTFKSKFNTFVKTELVDKLLSTYFEDYAFTENSVIPLENVNRAGLYQSPDRYNGEDLITGKYKNIEFKVSDVRMLEKHVVRTKNGTHVTYVPFFTGRWYIYKFPKKLEHTLKIVENRFGANTNGLKKYETEMIEFNKKFSIFASDQSFFYQLITPYMIERLLLLEKAHRGSIGYAFIGDELHIAINDNSNSLELSFNKVINQENIIHFIEDIKLIKDIIDELYLDDVKFR